MQRRSFIAAALLTASAGLGVALVATAQDRPSDRPADRTAKDKDSDRRDDTKRDHDFDRASDKFTLDCRIGLVTDNDVIPPTLFGHFPTKGTLTFVGVADILHGRMGDIRLDGCRFAYFGRAAGDWKRGKSFDNLSLYIDEATANSEQRNALGQIFRGSENLRSEVIVPLVVTKFDIAGNPSDPLGTTRVKIGDRGEFSITPLKGADGRNPIGIVNGFSFFDDREPVLLGNGNANFADHGRSLKITNGSAEVHYARLQGVVKGVVEEEGTIHKD